MNICQESRKMIQIKYNRTKHPHLLRRDDMKKSEHSLIGRKVQLVEKKIISQLIVRPIALSLH